MEFYTLTLIAIIMPVGSQLIKLTHTLLSRIDGGHQDHDVRIRFYASCLERLHRSLILS